MAGRVRFVNIADTTWPVPLVWGNESGPEWVQRYGLDGAVVEQRMSVASIVAAYSHLIDPNITQARAVDGLKLARRAAVIAKVAQESVED